MKVFRTLDTYLTKLIEVFVVIAFIAMVILVAAQVFVRYLTTSSLTWSDEASRYLMVYMIFFGMVVLVKERRHVAVPNLVDALPPKVKKAVLFISYIIQLLFFSAMVYGYTLIQKTASLRTSAALFIPMNIVYICIPITGALMASYIIRDIAELIRGGNDNA